MPLNEWVAAASVEEFSRTTVRILATEPVRNTLLLTVFDRLRTEGPHAFGERDPQLLTWYDAAGSATGALLRTPPHPFVLTDVPPESIEGLVDLIADPESGLDGREINLPLVCEAPVIAAWASRTGNDPRVVERFRLYRLEELVTPDPVPAGKPRLATDGDVELIAGYMQGFWSEVEHSVPADARGMAMLMAEGRVAEGLFWLWVDESDAPVALAGHTPVIAGMSRIGPVYTPPELRGHGYAASATIAATRAAQAWGAGEVLLFTDLANDVSNRLYQRIGYRPVSDRAQLEFTG